MQAHFHRDGIEISERERDGFAREREGRWGDSPTGSGGSTPPSRARRLGQRRARHHGRRVRPVH